MERNTLSTSRLTRSVKWTVQERAGSVLRSQPAILPRLPRRLSRKKSLTSTSLEMTWSTPCLRGADWTGTDSTSTSPTVFPIKQFSLDQHGVPFSEGWIPFRFPRLAYASGSLRGYLSAHIALRASLDAQSS